MGKKKLVLWDYDSTLGDPRGPEKKTVAECFRRLGLGTCPEDLLSSFRDINVKWWTLFEEGKITRQQLYVGRFEETLSNYGFDKSVAPQFNDLYLELLGTYAVPLDGALDVLAQLKGKVMQCMITNGPEKSQSRKLVYSGVGQFMDRVYISETVGFEKPDVHFFDSVLADFPLLDKDSIVVIGDSLTTDMTGANNAGLDCIWYNPKCLSAPDNLKINYTIRSLQEVPELVLKETF